MFCDIYLQSKRTFRYQKEHFGIKKIREWLDDLKWQQSYPKFDSLFDHEKKEIKVAVEQASAGSILRNWMAL